MSKPTPSDLMAVLVKHIGAENGATAKAFAERLACAERDVRFLITELRMQGVAVCGHPKTGYFIAANAAELEKTCEFLRSRAMHSLVLESKLRHVPLPDLVGQLRLKT